MNVQESVLDAFKASLRGNLIGADDEGYDEGAQSL